MKVSFDKSTLRYSLPNKLLCIDDNRLIPPFEEEKNEMGVCSECEGPLFSFTYHNFQDYTAVVCRCDDCSLLRIILFDPAWEWVGEYPVSIIDDASQNSVNLVENKSISDIGNIAAVKLETVFSPREIEAMIQKSKGENYVRQYLYNARKKYSLFTELFGYYLEI
ncbi:hypothetical protein [Methanohalophilus sp. DAL1]|uniref:hypothetical protein n=1 Tax=Methanohalophilus sp. DAL1 TaxID=1864608 RepID=UPI0008174250|nr:hypothetical protein [Methanohalophilus sp. DAL1]OBZ35216.1 MAG: hypothetical protein A9957_08435 [Methanohalophilus sp. DAL1]